MDCTIRLIFIAMLLAVGATSADDQEPSPPTGYFALSFSPLELLGEDGLVKADYILRGQDELNWQLYVPPDYDPSRPAGVVVYVSPTEKGGPPRVWNELLQQNNLIWIGANQAGNRVAVGKRMFLAMLAPKVVATRYAVDVDRIYIAGFSGGGKTAGRVMAAKPELFRGGIYIGGAEVWGKNDPPPRLDIIQQNYHVFLSGTEDFNERLTRRVYRAFKNAGIEHCELIIERRHGHQLPSQGVFGQAIAYLDARMTGNIPGVDSQKP